MKIAKKVLLVLGVLVGLLLVAIVAIPFFVNVDKYRPQITEAANAKLNGKLELGKLSLSLWGQVRVSVEGVSLADSAGRKVFEVKDAYFHLPLGSVLSGHPQMIFKVEAPSVTVIKNKAGKLNVMSLMKPTPATAAGTPGGAAAAGGKPAPAAGSGEVALPAIVAQATLGIEFLHAHVSYKDELTALVSETKDLNLVIKDLSLSRPTSIDVQASLDTKMGKSMSFKGPASLRALVKPELNGAVFERAAVEAQVNLDLLEISMPGLFNKTKNIPANADFAFTVSPAETKVAKIFIKFYNAELKGEATLKTPPAPAGQPASAAPAPNVDFRITSNAIDLKPWSLIIPMLTEYELTGVAGFDASGSGPSDRLGYQAHLGIENLTARAGKLKAQPRFDFKVDIVTDQVKNLELAMKAPGNDLRIQGKVVSFTQPQAQFQVTSSGMDLDQLIDWPPPPKETGAAPTAAGAPAGTGTAQVPLADTDASVDPLRLNPMLANASAIINFNMKMVQAKKIKLTDIGGKLYYKNLTAGMEGFGMKLWDGTIKGNFAANLKPKAPTYNFSTVLDGLDLKQAVEANVAAFKNTVVGHAHFEISGSGESFNTEPAKQNLKAKGGFKITKAQLKTIDVGKMASEAVNGALAKIGDKVPQAKGKTLGAPNGRESRYELISSDFTIENGQFNMPNFFAKAEPNQGIELKGATQLGMKDMALKTSWEVIDTYNLLKARDLDVEVAGTKVPHLLAEGNNPVKFVVHAGCTAMAPCYSYTEVPEYLAKVAMNNVAQAAEGRAKAEVRKQIDKVIPQVVPQAAPPAVKNAVDEARKRFGF